MYSQCIFNAEKRNETMEDLKSDYQEIEETFEWPEPPKGFLETDQYYRLGKELRAKIRERSLREKLDPYLYEERINVLLELVENLRYSLNQSLINTPDEKKNEQRVWFHQDNFLSSGFVNMNDLPKINRNDLISVAATYLANPWMKNDKIDWIFIDSLIFAEISAYSEFILSGQAVGKLNWSYALSEGNLVKAYWFHVTKYLVAAVARYIIPPIIIYALYKLHSEDAAMVAGALYLAYLLLHFTLWPKRYRDRKSKEKLLKEHTDRLQTMLSAYCYCNPPVISLATLRQYLNKAVEAGAIFEGSLFAIIDRVEETRGEAFLPFAKPTATVEK